jgi:hypothetical protein
MFLGQLTQGRAQQQSVQSRVHLVGCGAVGDLLDVGRTGFVPVPRAATFVDDEVTRHGEQPRPG